jgi:NAD(P)-dependent dehydrogenase (short-subunit alcohol dehydrogenase family)
MTATGTNNTAIVTGGSKGFGRALAAELARQGWAVVIDGRDAEPLYRTAQEIGAIPVAGDITDPEHRALLVATARQAGPRLDLLVNNASTLGVSPLPGLVQYPLADLRVVFETNVLAPLALTQLALPLLAESGGAVLNVTSDAAVEAYDGWGGYGSSKAALEQWGHVLAVEQPGTRIWSFDPGDMRTEMHQAAFPGQDISDRPEPASVVPAALVLLQERPPSGRVKAADLLPAGAA